MYYDLRDYQVESVNVGKKFLIENKSGGGLMVLPTGSGKSIIIAAIAKELPGNTLVLQPSKELVEQNYAKMVSYVGKDSIGIYSASAGRKDIGKITFATIGSIINKKELFAEFSNIIVDEAHLVNSKGGRYEDLINTLGLPVLGLTATPYRLHAYADNFTGERSVVAKFLHRTRPRIFNKLIHVTQIKDLYEKGFLCPVMYEMNDLYDHARIKLNSTGMDFDQEALLAYNQRIGLIGIIKNAIEKSNSKHILVFNSLVLEAQDLAQRLKESGISVASVSALTPKKEREEIIEKFRSGEIKVVTNVGVLTTGFDFPELDCIVLARPTQSVALYYQMIGRGIRIAEGKEFVKVIDACGNTKRFGMIGDFEIVEPKAQLHRLKSNVSYLTGFDFVSNVDLETVGYKGKKEATGFFRPMTTVTFGKYKGQALSQVPIDYLKWIVLKFDKGYVKDAFANEIKKREGV